MRVIAAGLWHAGRVTVRSFLAAVIAAGLGLGLVSVSPAEAQLWKPKKKPAATAAPAKKKTVVRKKRTRRAAPPAKVAADTSRDRGRSDDVDDRPRITVVDGEPD